MSVGALVMIMAVKVAPTALHQRKQGCWVGQDVGGEGGVHGWMDDVM